MKNNRRKFFKSIGLLTAGALASGLLSDKSFAQKKIQWKMVTSWPKNFPGLGAGAETLANYINLLSGGEKAGTGIAFVFSIFKSNPAPFCLLDEVDAPLDDANNSRFCSVVREMSESVQFIFITHNKLTMELADILNGVTMREAGISKMVTVNVNDAIKLAETQPNSSVQDRPS